MGRGALVFKGDESSIKKKKKKSKHKSELTGDKPIDDQRATSVPEYATAPASQQRQQQQPQLEDGDGTITTSGTVVTGRKTNFTSQIRVGDALLIGQDMRVVTMVLSDLSLNLSSAFAQNHKQPVRYSFIAKPRLDSAPIGKDSEQKKEDEKKTHAFGNYAGSEIVYRKRTENGNYRIEREGASANLTRSDLLQLRSKKTSDKYC